MAQRLSPRELVVLRLVACGRSNREIAAQLGLAAKTVEHMLGSADPYRAIYPKIQVTNRAEAAAWYVAHVGDPAQEPAPEALDSSAPVDGGLADQLLAVLTGYEERIYAVRLSGQPELAIGMADFVTAQTQQAALRASMQPYADALNRLCLSALVQKGTGMLELAVAGVAVQRVRPVASALADLAATVQDRHYAGLAIAMMAGAHNIDRDYGRGLALARKTLAMRLGPDARLRALRTGVVAALYLQDRATVAALTTHTRRVI